MFFTWRFPDYPGFRFLLVGGYRPPVDTGINLSFTAQERYCIPAEMRKMLASIQGIVQGIGESDRNRIAEFARLSGNRMARATPASVRSEVAAVFLGYWRPDAYDVRRVGHPRGNSTRWRCSPDRREH